MAYNSILNDSVQEKLPEPDNIGFLSIFKKLKRKITTFLFEDEDSPLRQNRANDNSGERDHLYENSSAYNYPNHYNNVYEAPSLLIHGSYRAAAVNETIEPPISNNKNIQLYNENTKSFDKRSIASRLSDDSKVTSCTKKKPHPVIKITNFIVNKKFNEDQPYVSKNTSLSAFRLLNGKSNSIRAKKFINFTDQLKNSTTIIRPTFKRIDDAENFESLLHKKRVSGEKFDNNYSKKKNDTSFDLKSLNSNYIKQWVKNELDATNDRKVNSIVNKKNSTKTLISQSTQQSKHFIHSVSSHNQNTIYNEKVRSKIKVMDREGGSAGKSANPYKCIFNSNEKSFSTSSINDLKTEFEQRRVENHKLYEEMKKKATLKALINLEDSTYFNQLKGYVHKSSVKDKMINPAEEEAEEVSLKNSNEKGIEVKNSKNIEVKNHSSVLVDQEKKPFEDLKPKTDLGDKISFEGFKSIGNGSIASNMINSSYSFGDSNRMGNSTLGNPISSVSTGLFPSKADDTNKPQSNAPSIGIFGKSNSSFLEPPKPVEIIFAGSSGSLFTNSTDESKKVTDKNPFIAAQTSSEPKEKTILEEKVEPTTKPKVFGGFTAKQPSVFGNPQTFFSKAIPPKESGESKSISNSNEENTTIKDSQKQEDKKLDQTFSSFSSDKPKPAGSLFSGENIFGKTTSESKNDQPKVSSLFGGSSESFTNSSVNPSNIFGSTKPSNLFGTKNEESNKEKDKATDTTSNPTTESVKVSPSLFQPISSAVESKSKLFDSSTSSNLPASKGVEKVESQNVTFIPPEESVKPIFSQTSSLFGGATSSSIFGQAETKIPDSIGSKPASKENQEPKISNAFSNGSSKGIFGGNVVSSTSENAEPTKEKEPSANLSSFFTNKSANVTASIPGSTSLFGNTTANKEATDKSLSIFGSSDKSETKPPEEKSEPPKTSMFGQGSLFGQPLMPPSIKPPNPQENGSNNSSGNLMSSSNPFLSKIAPTSKSLFESPSNGEKIGSSYGSNQRNNKTNKDLFGGGQQDGILNSNSMFSNNFGNKTISATQTLANNPFNSTGNSFGSQPVNIFGGSTTNSFGGFGANNETMPISPVTSPQIAPKNVDNKAGGLFGNQGGIFGGGSFNSNQTSSIFGGTGAPTGASASNIFNSTGSQAPLGIFGGGPFSGSNNEQQNSGGLFSAFPQEKKDLFGSLSTGGGLELNKTTSRGFSIGKK